MMFFYGYGNYMNRLYILNFEMPLLNINYKNNRLDNQYLSYLWHYRLSHIIIKLYKKEHFHPFDYESYETCKTCLLDKMIKTSFTGKRERSKKLLGLIHTDLHGVMTIIVIGGNIYFIIFIDGYYRYAYIYLMKWK